MSIQSNTKGRSEAFLSLKHAKDYASETTTSRSTVNLKLPNIYTKSPVTRSDRQLFNSYFSYLPAGAVVMLPPNIKEQERCIDYFVKNVYDYRIDKSVPGRREVYDTLTKTMNYEEAEHLLENSKRVQFNKLRPKKRGSMYLSEFWTKKQARKVMRTSELDKAYDATKEVERQGLPARLEKLEKLYEKRQVLQKDLLLTDIEKLLEDFRNQGINAPTLKFHRRNVGQQMKGVSSLTKAESNIFDDEDQGRSVEEEKTRKEIPSLDIGDSMHDEYTIDSPTTRRKSRSINLVEDLRLQRVEKAKSLVRLPLTKVIGPPTDYGESTRDVDSLDNKYMCSTSIAHSQAIIMVEDGQDGGNRQSVGESCRKGHAKAKKSAFGLSAIREIAKGGKENSKIGVLREINNFGSALSGRYGRTLDSVRRKKVEEKKSVEAGDYNQNEEEVGKSRSRDYKNGRKSLWVVPQKNKHMKGI